MRKASYFPSVSSGASSPYAEEDDLDDSGEFVLGTTSRGSHAAGARKRRRGVSTSNSSAGRRASIRTNNNNDDPNTGDDASTDKVKKQRACEPCRAKKIKCDRQANCLNCRLHGKECFYTGVGPISAPSTIQPTSEQRELIEARIEIARLRALIDVLLVHVAEQGQGRHPTRPTPIAPPAAPTGPSRRHSDYDGHINRSRQSFQPSLSFEEPRSKSEANSVISNGDSDEAPALTRCNCSPTDSATPPFASTSYTSAPTRPQAPLQPNQMPSSSSLPLPLPLPLPEMTLEQTKAILRWAAQHQQLASVPNNAVGSAPTASKGANSNVNNVEVGAAPLAQSTSQHQASFAPSPSSQHWLSAFGIANLDVEQAPQYQQLHYLASSKRDVGGQAESWLRSADQDHGEHTLSGVDANDMTWLQ